MGNEIDLMMSRVGNLLSEMDRINAPPYERKSLPDCSIGELRLILEALTLLGAIRSAAMGAVRR